MVTFRVKIIPKGIVKEVRIPDKRNIKVHELIRILGYTVEDVVVTKDNKVLSEYDTINEGDEITVFTVFSGG